MCACTCICTCARVRVHAHAYTCACMCARMRGWMVLVAAPRRVWRCLGRAYAPMCMCMHVHAYMPAAVELLSSRGQHCRAGAESGQCAAAQTFRPGERGARHTARGEPRDCAHSFLRCSPVGASTDKCCRLCARMTPLRHSFLALLRKAILCKRFVCGSSVQ